MINRKIKFINNAIYHDEENKQTKQAFEILDTLNKDKYLTNVLYGKMYIKQEEYEKAKYYLYNALNIDNTKLSAHYALFRLFIYEKDFINAFNFLKSYEALAKDKKGEVYLDAYNILLRSILDLNASKRFYDLNIIEKNHINLSKIDNEKILKRYKAFTHYLKQYKFEEALKELRICDELCKEENCFYSFKELLILTEYIKKHALYCRDYTLQHYNLDRMSYKQLIGLMRLDIYNFDNLIIIRRMIKNNELFRAEEIIKSFDQLDVYNEELRYLKNCLKEKRKIEDDDTIFFIKSGRKCYQKENYKDALSEYKKGLKKTNNAIFNYYIGKMYYKLGRKKDASRYLKIYAHFGADKLSKCYLYLYLCSKDKRDYYKKKIDIISKIEETDFQIKTLEEKKYEEVVVTLEEIKSNEIKGTKETIETLKEIKRLYESGRQKEGDKLLKSLSQKKDKTKEEKIEIEDMQKQKKLYLNKYKYGL